MPASRRRRCRSCFARARSSPRRPASASRLDRTLGYVYDRAAAKLRARRRRRSASIVCEITNPFYAELTAGIDEALDRAGWVAFLANTAESPVRQDRFIERMREHRVDGLLLAPAEGTDPDVVERLLRLEHAGGADAAPPRQARRRPCRRRFPARHDACRRTSDPLGHKRIAFVGGGRRASPARDRAAAYRETLARYGLPSARSSIACRPARKARARSSGCCTAAPNDPTAILCYNDICASGRAARACRPRPRRRPRLRRHRLRQHCRGGPLSAGADHRRDRRPPDRRGGRASAAPPHQGAERRAGEHHPAAAARSCGRAAAARLPG